MTAIDASYPAPPAPGGTLSQWLHNLAGLSLPLVALAPLLLPHGGLWALGALALLGLAVAGRDLLAAQRLEWRLPLLLAAAALAWWATGYWHGDGRRALPFAAVLLMAGLAAGARPLLAPWQASWWWGLGLTGVITGAWALWQRGPLGVSRADGLDPMHAILYGNLSLLAGVCCLAGLAWAWSQPRRRPWVAWLLAGALGGLLASLLSGSRGGWVALPVAAWLLYRLWWRRWPVRRQWGLGLVAAGLLALVVALPQSGVQGRVAVAVAEVQAYLAGDARGSVGTRLEIYRGSAALIAERPLLGHGHQGYRDGMRQQVEEGRLIASVARHWHAHNDPLDAWVRRGLPGLLIVLGLYLVPLWAVMRALPGAHGGARSLALAGLMLPVMFFDFGLSYAFFAYSQVLAAYLAWALVLVPPRSPARGGFRAR
jgi:O-antigen ligase